MPFNDKFIIKFIIHLPQSAAKQLVVVVVVMMLSIVLKPTSKYFRLKPGLKYWALKNSIWLIETKTRERERERASKDLGKGA